MPLGNDFDADTEEAVQALQDDAGLAETGVVNSATWDALFDLDDTGLSLRAAYTAPLAQLSAVRKWNYTSNGSKASMNDGYDADAHRGRPHDPRLRRQEARPPLVQARTGEGADRQELDRHHHARH